MIMWPHMLLVRGVHYFFPEFSGKLLQQLLYILHYFTQLFFFWSLSLCTSLWSSPPLCFSLISLCQHIPQTHPPSLPFTVFSWLEIVRGGRKLCVVVGIYVSWSNSLHMLVIMVQDVADIICSLFHSFFFPSQVLLAHLPPSSFLYGSCSCSLVCSTPPPPHPTCQRCQDRQIRLWWHIMACGFCLKSEVRSLCWSCNLSCWFAAAVGVLISMCSSLTLFCGLLQQ